MHRPGPLPFSDQRPTLRRRATRRIRNRQKRERGAQHDGGSARAGAAEWVARLVGVRVVRDSGDDEVRAVGADQARLREPGARARLLHGGVHTEHSDRHTQRQVDRDEHTVERAPGPREEGVEEAGEGEGGDVGGGGGENKDPLPSVGGGALPLFDAGFGPGVGEVDEEDEAEEDKEGGADEGDIVAPEDEEAVWDEEGGGHEDKPEEHFRAPPTREVSARLNVDSERRTRSVWRRAYRGCL